MITGFKPAEATSTAIRGYTPSEAPTIRLEITVPKLPQPQNLKRGYSKSAAQLGTAVANQIVKKK